ncbi:GNAT family N-acetyltransferase [Agromyces sp. ISL-38]|uniref:GNAT family N-acetyltransferase n=1 Tax=Agromyces sp. ISL-38 TaxID=2819107 RepID=UPI001BE554C0|nr:GNAT family N-acetyltransferase [Agromyces sp. ISL-38]MBT2500483.1 GNAT family N-acetyltransferase [Agromyces sp. ISL-38]MBT2519225.1 GNAT family N-acetyltransferase [Streptomyces sp. ISL-90]
MLRFREADVTDADAHGLLEAYFAERAAGFPPEQGEYRPTWPDAAQFTPPAGVFLVAIDVDGAGEAVGCGGVRRIQRSPADEVRFEVKHVWLAPAGRGRGEGRRLLDELERRAAELGAEEIVLDTNASLEAAGGLYRSSGYTEIEPYNANPNATHWFGKRLPR